MSSFLKRKKPDEFGDEFGDERSRKNHKVDRSEGNQHSQGDRSDGSISVMSTTIEDDAVDALMKLTRECSVEPIKDDGSLSVLISAIPKKAQVDTLGNHPENIRFMIDERLTDSCLYNYVLVDLQKETNFFQSFVNVFDRNKINDTTKKINDTKIKMIAIEKNKTLVDINKKPKITVDDFLMILVSNCWDTVAKFGDAITNLYNQEYQKERKVTSLFMMLAAYLCKHYKDEFSNIYTADSIEGIKKEIDQMIFKIMVQPGLPKNAAVIAQANRLHHEKYNIDQSVVTKIESESQSDDTIISESVPTATVYVAERVSSILYTMLFAKQADDTNIKNFVLNKLIEKGNTTTKDSNNNLITTIESMLKILRSEDQYDIDGFQTNVVTLPDITDEGQRELNNVNYNNDLRKEILYLIVASSIHISNGNTCKGIINGHEGGKKANKTKKTYVKGNKRRTKKQKRNARKTKKKQKKTTRRRKLA